MSHVFSDSDWRQAVVQARTTTHVPNNVQPLVDWLNRYLKPLTDTEAREVFLETYQFEVPEECRVIKLLNIFLDLLGIDNVAMMVDEDSGEVKGFCKYDPPPKQHIS